MDKIIEILIKFCPAFILACLTNTSIVIYSIFFLVFFDNFCKIYYNFKFRKKLKKPWFDYKKCFKTIEKFILYSFCIVGAYLVDGIAGLELGIYKFVGTYIAIYELISIYNHVSKITGMTFFIDMAEYLKEKMKFIKKKDSENN